MRPGRRTGRSLLAAALTLAGLAAACDLDEEGVAPTTLPATERSAAAGTSSGTPTATPTSEPDLEDGRHFGYILDIDIEGNPPSIVFDLAEFLTGDEANDAAVEDGVIAEGESVPNDYYIRNRNPMLRTLSVTLDVSISVVNWENCCESIPGELEPFAQAFSAKDPPLGIYRGTYSPYWLTVQEGQIVTIEEQYLP